MTEVAADEGKKKVTPKWAEKRRNDKRKLGEDFVNPNLLDEDVEASLAKKLFGFKGGANSSSESDSEDEEPTPVTAPSSRSVWHDDDDDASEQIALPTKKSGLLLKKSTDDGDTVSKQEYQQRLRSAFQRTHNAGKVPSWAKLDSTSDVVKKTADSDDEVEAALEEMTRSTGKYVQRDDILPKGVIDMQLIQDMTVGHSDSRSLKVLRFHKTKPVLLTAGESGCIQLYQVDNEVKKEHFLQNVRFSRFPINSMDFLAGGNSVICGSTRQEYFMRYDLEKGAVSQSRLPRSVQAQNVGKFAVSSDGSLLAMAGHTGQVHLLSAVSMEHIKTMAVPAEVVSLAFMPGSNQEVWISTERGQIHVWDIKAVSLHSFVDEGSVKGTQIRLSREGTYIACGSNTGIVNVYDPSEARTKPDPKPLATITTLLTACDSIAFSHDCEILTTTSAVKYNQVKLMHMRSKTMFSNFPGSFEKIPMPECVEFSPHSGYMAVGCQTGQLRMYRVGHYEGY